MNNDLSITMITGKCYKYKMYIKCKLGIPVNFVLNIKL